MFIGLPSFMLMIGIESQLLPAVTCNEVMLLDNTTSLWAEAAMPMHEAAPANNSFVRRFSNISVKQ